MYLGPEQPLIVLGKISFTPSGDCRLGSAAVVPKLAAVFRSVHSMLLVW